MRMSFLRGLLPMCKPPCYSEFRRHEPSWCNQETTSIDCNSSQGEGPNLVAWIWLDVSSCVHECQLIPLLNCRGPSRLYCVLVNIIVYTEYSRESGLQEVWDQMWEIWGKFSPREYTQTQKAGPVTQSHIHDLDVFCRQTISSVLQSIQVSDWHKFYRSLPQKYMCAKTLIWDSKHHLWAELIHHPYRRQIFRSECMESMSPYCWLYYF